MSKPELPDPSKVTLEDLLRWKRSERPPQEFWARFEQELRTKQLAALVEKPKWWHGSLRTVGRFSRYGLALGSISALALSFVTLRNHGYLSAYRFKSMASTSTLTAVTQADIPSDSVSIAVASTARTSPKSVSTAADLSVAASEPRIGEETTSAQLDSAEIAEMIPWVGSALQNPAQVTGESSPSAKSIAANLAAAEASDLSGMTNLGKGRAISASRNQSGTGEFKAESLPSATAAFEDPRRARLASYRQTSPDAYEPEPTAPVHVRERITRYLVDGAWDHEITRLDSRGDRLSIKF